MGEDSQLSEFFEWLYLDGIPILDYKDLVESSNKLNDYVGPIHSMPLWHSASIASSRRTMKYVSLDQIKPSDTHPIQLIHLTLVTPIQKHHEVNTSNLQDIVNAVKDRPNIKIVFTNMWDIWGSTYITEEGEIDVVKWICDILEPMQENVFWMLANQHIVNLVNQYLPNTNAVYNTVYYRNTVIINEKYKPSTEYRPYHFLCLNNRIKAHRNEIYDLLDNDKCIKTYMEKGQTLEVQGSEYEYYYYFTFNEQCAIGISTETNFRKKQSEETDNKNFPEKGYIDGHNKGFFTEKTIKSFWSKQIPFIVGTCNIHKIAMDAGFRFHSDLIDFSFDYIEDDDKRMDAIKTELKRLEDIDIEVINKYYNSDKCQEILDHNHELCKKYSKFNFNTYILGIHNGTR